MAYSDYVAALASFRSDPSETNKRAVLTRRMELGDTVQTDAGTVVLPNIATLTSSLEEMAAGAISAGDPKRLIRFGTAHRG